MEDLVTLHVFKDEWSETYKHITERMRSLLPEKTAFHHIGSTAIPGLRAKDVIDIQVTVYSLDEIDLVAMKQQGFVHRAGLKDHCPEGMTLAASELEKLFFNHLKPAANIHVRVRGAFNQRFPLISRDFLRANTAAAKAYEKIKVECAKRFPNDKDSYYAVKDPVFDLVYEAAEQWAKAKGWVEPPQD